MFFFKNFKTQFMDNGKLSDKMSLNYNTILVLYSTLSVMHEKFTVIPNCLRVLHFLLLTH
jgi:hypothetical protein